MQKILLDKGNAQSIAKEVSDVCSIYSHFSGKQLDKIDLLSALARVFGYKTGWAELMAVNKSERFYISFSMHVCSHVRAIINQLTKFLPKIDKVLLLVSVSFAELNVRNPEQYYWIKSQTIFEKDEFVFWFTRNPNAVDKHIACSPFATLIERQGIQLKHFYKLWPELSQYLRAKYQLSPEQVLLFERPVWWHYRDRFDNTYHDSEIGHIEIHFGNSTKEKRVCYEPLYINGENPTLDDFSSVFAEGLCGCPAPDHINNDLSDTDFLLACLHYWESTKGIQQVRISFKRDYQGHFKSPQFAFLMPYFVEHNESMDAIRNQLTSLDFTETLWGYEPRFIHNKDGSKKIYLEPWIVERDAKNFVQVNEEIHSNINKFDRTKLLFVAQFLNQYDKERFAI